MQIAIAGRLTQRLGPGSRLQSALKFPKTHGDERKPVVYLAQPVPLLGLFEQRHGLLPMHQGFSGLTDIVDNHHEQIMRSAQSGLLPTA